MNLRRLPTSRLQSTHSLAGKTGMDLKNPSLISLKGILFGMILVIAATYIIVCTRDWLIAAMLTLVIWSAARGYYFMFYVIERYVDPSYRFAGILDFLRYALRSRNGVRHGAAVQKPTQLGESHDA